MPTYPDTDRAARLARRDGTPGKHRATLPAACPACTTAARLAPAAVADHDRATADDRAFLARVAAGEPARMRPSEARAMLARWDAARARIAAPRCHAHR